MKRLKSEEIVATRENILDRILIEDFKNLESYVDIGNGVKIGASMIFRGNGYPLVGMSSWYELKEALQEASDLTRSRISIPTSAEWSRARVLAQKQDEEKGIDFNNSDSAERSYLTGVPEYTDSVVDFTAPDKVILHTDARIESGRITNSKELDVSRINGKSFPIKGHYIVSFDEKTGLASEVSVDKHRPISLYEVLPEGLRVVIRKGPETNLEHRRNRLYMGFTPDQPGRDTEGEYFKRPGEPFYPEEYTGFRLRVE